MALPLTAFIHARLLTMSGPSIEHGYLVLAGDQIAAVGSGELPGEYRDAAIEDCTGLTILPGLIDAHCHVGLFNDGLGSEGEDGNEEVDPVTPHLLATDGIYSSDRCFSEALAAGVTITVTGPGSANVISGQFAALHTAGRRVETMTLNRQTALKAALGENPKKVYGAKDHGPATRMGTAAIFRESMQKASRYNDKLIKYQTADNRGDKPGDPPELDVKLEALLPALRGEQIVKFHAHRADDILTAVRVANEFGLRYTLDHCTEGYQIADLLAEEYRAGLSADCGQGQSGKARLMGVIVGPIISDRSKPEVRGLELFNAARLHEAGVPVAIMTDHPVVPIQYLALSAALTVRAGLPKETALEAITLTAARLTDLSDRYGSLDVGKQADLLILHGHPFDYLSRTHKVYLAGQLAWQEAAQ